MSKERREATEVRPAVCESGGQVEIRIAKAQRAVNIAKVKRNAERMSRRIKQFGGTSGLAQACDLRFFARANYFLESYPGIANRKPDPISTDFSFRRPNLFLQIVSLSICLGVAFVAAAGQSANHPTQNKDTDLVVHALCGKSVALLGESPVHGFGKTLEFKVEVVRKLIDQCHYDALFIESGTYDYINNAELGIGSEEI